MVEDAKIKNGSFNDSLSGYEVYVDSTAKATVVVDSLKENNALDVTVDDTGADDWRIQIKQNNVLLEKERSINYHMRLSQPLIENQSCNAGWSGSWMAGIL